MTTQEECITINVSDSLHRMSYSFAHILGKQKVSIQNLTYICSYVYKCNMQQRARFYLSRQMNMKVIFFIMQHLKL